MATHQRATPASPAQPSTEPKRVPEQLGTATTPTVGSRTTNSPVDTNAGRGSASNRRVTERRTTDGQRAVSAPTVQESPKQTAPSAPQPQQTAPATTDRSSLSSRLGGARDRAAARRGGSTAPATARPQSPVAPSERVQTPDRTAGTRSGPMVRSRSGDRSVRTVESQTQSRPAVAVQQQVRQAEVRREGLATRLRESRQLRTPVHSSVATPTTIGTIRTDSIMRRSYVHARYYDRPDLIAHTNHHVYGYYDSYHHLHHRIIWPTYYYPVCYSFGPHAYFSYVWPYYHRKYVFISLGGWWPYDYDYMRYYWYGYHPYVWYGYYPTAYEVPVDNNNYYTYNYYGTDGTETSVQSNQPIDQSSWADVRAKLDQQKGQPAAQTLADTRFEEAVKSFEAGNYNVAANQFAEAMAQAPNDVILPFAYAQALFANQQYAEAAKVLRVALQKVTPDKEGIFFPRGLYANDDVLFAQVEKLVDKADQSEDDADLQLLLGYQLLGVGETGYAREPLEQAAQDPKNAEAAQILLKLLEKVESKAGAVNKTDAGDAKATGVPNADVKNAVDAGATVTAAPQTPTVGAPLSATPNVQSDKPSGADGVKEEQAAPDKPDAAGVDKAAQPAGEKDAGGTPPLPQGPLNSGVVEDSGTAPTNGVVEATLGSLPTVRPSVGSLLSYAGFGLMTFLGSLAVGMQWRHLNDAPVRSLFGRGA